jgi:hypothetical protein
VNVSAIFNELSKNSRFQVGDRVSLEWSKESYFVVALVLSCHSAASSCVKLEVVHGKTFREAMNNNYLRYVVAPHELAYYSEIVPEEKTAPRQSKIAIEWKGGGS